MAPPTLRPPPPDTTTPPGPRLLEGGSYERGAGGADRPASWHAHRLTNIPICPASGCVLGLASGISPAGPAHVSATSWNRGMEGVYIRNTGYSHTGRAFLTRRRVVGQRGLAQGATGRIVGLGLRCPSLQHSRLPGIILLSTATRLAGAGGCVRSVPISRTSTIAFQQPGAPPLVHSTLSSPAFTPHPLLLLAGMHPSPHGAILQHLFVTAAELLQSR